VLWECTKDLLKSQTSLEDRPIMFRFLNSLIKGQVVVCDGSFVLSFASNPWNISMSVDIFGFGCDMLHRAVKLSNQP
jgi:hypothetical protein